MNARLFLEYIKLCREYSRIPQNEDIPMIKKRIKLGLSNPVSFDMY